MRQPNDQEARNRATLEAFQAAWGERDVERLGGLITDDCVYSASVGPEPGTTWHGRDEVLAGFELMLANDPGNSACEETVYAGDKAFATWSIEAAGSDGISRTIRGSDVFDFQGGLIARKDAFRKVEANLSLAPALPATKTDDVNNLDEAMIEPHHSGDFIVRSFTKADVPQLLALMRGLARFEGYLDDFRVSEDDLIQFGLSAAPLFKALVAVDAAASSNVPGGDLDQLLGMCVLYRIPWTYDMKPKLVMKEMFVDEAARGRGVGAALLSAAQTCARRLDASALIWTVLKGNKRAEDFYRKQGSRPDPLWDNWVLPVKTA